MPTQYDDIIHRSRPVSPNHPPMPRQDRAAQFAAFAALTGYDDAVRETARLTESRLELDDSRKERLGRDIQYLLEHSPEEPEVRITYFLPDQKKSGGSYETASGVLRRLEPLSKTLVLSDGTRIPLEDVYDVRSDCLPEY